MCARPGVGKSDTSLSTSAVPCRTPGVGEIDDDDLGGTDEAGSSCRRAGAPPQQRADDLDGHASQNEACRAASEAELPGDLGTLLDESQACCAEASIFLQGLSTDELHELAAANSKVLPDLLRDLGLEAQEGETMLDVLFAHRAFLAPVAETAGAPHAAGATSALAAALETPSDVQMKSLLASLQTPTMVGTADHHGHNDCLSDALLQSLASQGYAKDWDRSARREICTQARRHLCAVHGLSPTSYPMLEHDVHARTLLRFFVGLEELWQSHVAPKQLHFAIVVLDRFNRALVHGEHGEVTEIPETNPVAVEPEDLEGDQEDVRITLYCNTFDNGQGYHYEWIYAADEEPGLASG
jgi:hypothetical protein